MPVRVSIVRYKAKKRAEYDYQIQKVPACRRVYVGPLEPDHSTGVDILTTAGNFVNLVQAPYWKRFYVLWP